MAEATTLADRLQSGEPFFTAWSAIPDSLTVELVAGLGFEAVTLDMQHGAHHEDSIVRSLLPIAHKRKHRLVRVPVGRFDIASRALDFGAEGIIAPMVNSIDDAKRFAAAVKYPPLGERSWGPGFAMPRAAAADAKGWLATANANTVSFAMIETRAALAAVDDILAVDGIDGLFVGPADFSIAWSNGESVDPLLEDMMGAVETIARKARAKSKHAAMYVNRPTDVGRLVGMGYQMFALGTEAAFMARGANALLEAARGSIV